VGRRAATAVDVAIAVAGATGADAATAAVLAGHDGSSINRSLTVAALMVSLALGDFLSEPRPSGSGYFV
jgi:hypothetical protein